MSLACFISWVMFPILSSESPLRCSFFQADLELPAENLQGLPDQRVILVSCFRWRSRSVSLFVSGARASGGEPGLRTGAGEGAAAGERVFREAGGGADGFRGVSGENIGADEADRAAEKFRRLV